MEYVYHGSSTSNLKKIEPRPSTHGTYVYATPYKELAIHFCKRCGDDLTYDIGHFSNDKVWELVEKIPGALEKMYNTKASVYTLSSENFKDIHTGFEEVVSRESVDVIEEQVIDNLYQEILNLSEEGIIKIYRYPNKPNRMQSDNSDIIEKWKYYKNELNKNFTKRDFDRLVFLHPYLLNKVNEVIGYFGIDYSYKVEDLITIFQERVKIQLHDITHEQYIECAFKLICDTYPEISDNINNIFDDYNNSLNNN